MTSSNLQTITLPIHGMTCGGCAANVERALVNLHGVTSAVVQLDASQATVSFDPARVDLLEFQQAVTGAGYSIPTEPAHLAIDGMSCMSCVSHVQSALEELPGVISAAVSLSKKHAEVTAVAGLAPADLMIQAVAAAGYQARLAEEQPAGSQSGDQAVNKGFAWRFRKPQKGG